MFHCYYHDHTSLNFKPHRNLFIFQVFRRSLRWPVKHELVAARYIPFKTAQKAPVPIIQQQPRLGCRCAEHAFDLKLRLKWSVNVGQSSKITGHHTWFYCNVGLQSPQTLKIQITSKKHQSTIRASHSIVLQEQTNPGLRENEECSGFINIDWMCLLGFGEMWNFWPLLGLVQCVYIYTHQIIYIYN